LAFIGEALGYGPGLIGKYIDNHLRSSKKDGKIDLSEANLEQAAKKAVNGVVPESEEEKVESHLHNIYLIKRAIEIDDLVVATTILSRNTNGTLTKTARNTGSLWQKLLGTAKPGVMNALWGLLKTFAGGIIGLGIVGGIMSATGIKGPGAKQEQKEQKQKGGLYYTNIAHNVEDTLIVHLDATIKDFSASFKTATGKNLKGSSRMALVLKELAKLNWVSSIDEINMAPTFIAPPVIELAKKLLPEAQYEEIAKPTGKIPAKMPIGKSTVKTPSKVKQVVNPKDELKQLLKGVY